MSLNQSRCDKNESQFRKPGGRRSGTSSSGQQRSFSGGRGRGGVGGPTTSTNNPNRSYKKFNNAQGRGNAGIVNTSDFSAASGSCSVENGGDAQPSSHVLSNAPPSAVVPKPADTSFQMPSRPLRKPPSSQSSYMISDSAMPSTPSKGDEAKGISLQFGSLSPGIMNGILVRARTSPAPPKLDEQKRDQALRDASRVVPAIPIPSAPKQELPKKDVLVMKHPVAQETNDKTNRDVHVASASDIAEALMPNIDTSHSGREFPSLGRITDRPVGSSRPGRRGIWTMNADRWNKQPGPSPSVRDPGMDLAYATNVIGLRAGAGPNYGVLRNPRAQGPIPHAGGILSRPMYSVGYQGLQRNNSDADRWQRGTNFNKGLMPPPQGPFQVRHKAKKKYEIGKDKEREKQRKLTDILNKLTPQNLNKLFEQVKEVDIDNAVTLTIVISLQLFDIALMEPTFCEPYANFCQHLASQLPEFSVDNKKITFKRLLLNKCQEEFEREEREEHEANNKTDNEGVDESKQYEQVSEELRLKTRRRKLGNIRLIGELFKKQMLTERIMHECIQKLLGQYQNRDEENIEASCELMSIIGGVIDHPKAKERMDAYFDIMGQLSNNMKLSSRVRFMLKDVINLRKNKWQQRTNVEGPKMIEEVHHDAAQERQQVLAELYYLL